MLKKIYDIDYCIHIKPIKRTDEEALSVAKSVSCSVYDASDSFKWHCINGKYYRFKFFDRIYPILNELIGPKLAKAMDLKTASYIPAILDYDDYFQMYGLISENFKDPTKQYVDMFDIGFKHKKKPDYKNIELLKGFCLEEDYYSLINDLFKMTCIDYLMEQVDRVASNFLFEKDGKHLSLAPLFDYAEAFDYAKHGCTFNKRENHDLNFSVANSFIAPNFNEKKFEKLLKKHPSFGAYLKRICEIDIISIINEIEAEHNLKISEEHKDYYYIRTREKQKVLF
ncbi:MAG: hypothetical protein PHI05_04655 [Bacilli bacterium]|nr:hypothetical protein [Bacilli bacterium]